MDSFRCDETMFPFAGDYRGNGRAVIALAVADPLPRPRNVRISLSLSRHYVDDLYRDESVPRDRFCRRITLGFATLLRRYSRRANPHAHTHTADNADGMRAAKKETTIKREKETSFLIRRSAKSACPGTERIRGGAACFFFGPAPSPCVNYSPLSGEICPPPPPPPVPPSPRWGSAALRELRASCFRDISRL